MTPLGPFEAAPTIAVAVSGGADSLALCLLAASWVRARRGDATALTVDHGLRSESAAEARQVARWLVGHGITHRILRWTGPTPASGIEAAARAARYGLLLDWCARARVLHLLVAHHQEDQAVTVLMRLGRGSGAEGLAAMRPVRLLRSETGAVRLLRPLLSVAPARLRGALARARQPWIDDPSNDDHRFARAKTQAGLAELARYGIDAAGLARAAEASASDRALVEHHCARWFVAHGRVDPTGYVALQHDAWLSAPFPLAERLLSRALVTASGAPYPPRRQKLRRLAEALRDAPSTPRTLGGCRFVPRRGALLVVREPRAARDVAPIGARRLVRWDRRFRVSAHGVAPGMALTIKRLGVQGLSEVRRAASSASPFTRALGRIPAPVRPSLPAVYDLEGVLAVPHLGFNRLGDGQETDHPRFGATFEPVWPLAGAGAGVIRVDTTVRSIVTPCV